MKKDKEGFIDPSVADLLQSGENRRAMAALPRAERAKAAKKKSLQAERNGRRGVYDLEPDLIELIKRLADEYGTTASGVAEILLRHGVLAIERDELELGNYRRRLERNPRYEYELVWRDEAESGEPRAESRQRREG